MLFRYKSEQKEIGIIDFTVDRKHLTVNSCVKDFNEEVKL